MPNEESDGYVHRVIYTFDPYSDGLAIVLRLSGPATQQDLRAASDLLDEWIDSYEVHGRCRNAEVSGALGESRIALCAERMVHPEGTSRVFADAERIGARAQQRMALASWTVTDLDSTLSADQREVAQRLGTPVFQVRPGGDVLKDLRRAGLVSTPGLRPATGWSTAVFLAAFFARRLDAPLKYWLHAAAIVFGVAGLQLASRHWCTTREHALAAVTCISAVVTLAMNLSGSNGDASLMVNLLPFGFLVAWHFSWIRQG